MSNRSRTRRRFIQATGASLLLGSAGCLGQGSSFETLSMKGETIPLVPTDTAYNWYTEDEVRFVDTRGKTAYEYAHINGAVLSPAPDGRRRNDPVEGWSKSTKIITYCACPHHLSSLRAANLIKQGYENVYALDNGIQHWIKKGHPIAGTKTEQLPEIKTIVGAADPQYGGETAWAYHRASGQREATEIESNGHYRLDLPFYEVTGQSPIEVVTPGYTIEKPLSKLMRGKITPKGTLSLEQPASQS
jgi:rhodanese-related sulfurtransferase